MEKTKEKEQYLRWKFKLRVLEFAKYYEKAKETCEMLNVSRNTNFNWKKNSKDGAEGHFRKKREFDTCLNRINQKTVDLILNLRKVYKLGAWRIK